MFRVCVLYKTDNCLGSLQQENEQLWHGNDTVKVVSVKCGKDVQLKGPGAFGFCSINRWMDLQRDGYHTWRCFHSSGFSELQYQLFVNFFMFRKFF